MTRAVKRGGKIWIRIFPDKPVTKKPAEIRMGSGKGAPDHWVAVVKPGPDPVRDGGRARGSGRRGHAPRGHKLPIKTRFVSREAREGVVEWKYHQGARTMDDEVLLSDERPAALALYDLASSGRRRDSRPRSLYLLPATARREV